MVSTIVIIAGAIAVSGIWVWRRRRLRASQDPLPQAGIPRETLALESFTHGNTCLAEGKFAEATAAFERAREIDPKRAHVADRLAEVIRRQQAALVTQPASSPS